jgi:hypothetical protein
MTKLSSDKVLGIEITAVGFGLVDVLFVGLIGLFVIRRGLGDFEGRPVGCTEGDPETEGVAEGIVYSLRHCQKRRAN